MAQRRPTDDFRGGTRPNPTGTRMLKVATVVAKPTAESPAVHAVVTVDASAASGAAFGEPATDSVAIPFSEVSRSRSPMYLLETEHFGCELQVPQSPFFD